MERVSLNCLSLTTALSLTMGAPTGGPGQISSTQREFAGALEGAFESHVLPASNYGEGRGRGVARFNEFDKSAISRFAFLTFFKSQAWRVESGSACLGWDDLKVVTKAFGSRCKPRLSVSFRHMDDNGRAAEVHNGVLRGDLGALSRPGALGASALGRFDLIACNEVFEHVGRPLEAARALFSLLRPGGHVFWSAPFLCRNHGVPNDFFRYSTEGAASIFTSAGFELLALHESANSGPLAIGFLLGFGTGDFNKTQLRKHLIGPDLSNRSARVSGSEDVPPNKMPNNGLYVGVLLVARKPNV